MNAGLGVCRKRQPAENQRTTPPIDVAGAGFVRLLNGHGRQVLSEAFRYWEARRIIYNLILAAVVAGWFAFTWPHFRGALTLQFVGFLAVLAILANLCYSAAYLADMPLQFSALHRAWRRWRGIVFAAGTLLAVLLANYWIADEIYPYVR